MPSSPPTPPAHGIAPTFCATVPTSLDHVRPLRRALEALLAAAGWSEDDVADAGLVATEVLQNAVEHGSRNDGTETVSVRCAFEGAVLTLEVSDPGSGKGPASLLQRDVTVPPPMDSSRGRGLYLVHRMSQRMARGTTPTGGSLVSVRMAPSGAP